VENKKILNVFLQIFKKIVGFAAEFSPKKIYHRPATNHTLAG
jgi:hypothetical protein